MTEHTKLTYTPLEKTLEKQTRKQADAFKFFNLSNKYLNLKIIESIFPRNQMNDLIIDF